MLYRRERRLSPVIIALVVALVCLPLGFWLGRLSAPTPSLAATLAPTTGAVRTAQGALDIVGLEFKRALEGSEESFQAAAAALARSRSELETANPVLTALYPDTMGEIASTFDALETSLAERASPEELTAELEHLLTQLERLQPKF